jgi:glyoxylase-like metal-dependent hydrolase (beta-lactamase superfamily II)
MVKVKKFENIDENLILIHNKVFPLYIVKGEKNFLIDCGATALVHTFLDGINRVMDGQNIDALLLTHTHWDHTGAASALQNEYHFEVLGSHRSVDLLSKSKVVKIINRLNQDYKKQVGDTSDTAFEMPGNLKGLGEGDRIRIDEDRYFEVIETPGHTRCSLSYLLQPEKILFPGDAAGVIEQDGSIKPLFLSSYRQYEESLLRLMNIEAAILAFPHNRYIRGPQRIKDFLNRSLMRTRQVRDFILQSLTEPYEVDRIAEDLVSKEFPRPTLLGPKEALMINMKAMVKVIARELTNFK